MFDETGASPHKCLARLPQQAQLSKTTAWRATKNLHLQLHKITQVQEIEEGNYKTRQHFCNWSLQAVHDGGILHP
jgi:IS1 family transposase